MEELQHVRHIPSTGDRATYEQKPEGSEGESHAEIWKKAFRQKECKGLETNTCYEGGTRRSVWLERSG